MLTAAGGLVVGTGLAGCSGSGGGDGSGGNGTPAATSDGSSGNGGGDTDSSPQSYNYNLATASSGGAWAVQGAGLAKLWNELDQVQVTAINTAGGGENPILIRDGEAGVAFQSGSNLYAVLNGEGPYDEPIELNSLFRTNTNPVWYAVRDGTDMTTMADLDGKRVAVGPRGSNANYESTLMFDHIGVDIESQYLSFSDAANAMANEQIDSMIVYGLIPAVQQLAEQTEIRPLTYADSFDSMLDEYPWAVESSFPAQAVDWYDESIPLIGKDIYLVTRPDVPEEFAYLVTKHTFDNIEAAREIHFLFSGMSLDGGARNLNGNIPIHPGSQTYFEEADAL